MITTAIILDHRNRPGKDGSMPIEVRIKSDSNKLYYINTGVKVLPKHFVGGAIVDRADKNELNERVRIIYSKVQEEVNKCIDGGYEPDIQNIRNRLKAAIENACRKDANDTTLVDFIEEQENMMQLKDGTLKHYRTLRVRLIEYGIIKNWQDVTIENICKFDSWLHGIKKPLSDAEIKAGKVAEPISDGAVYNYHKCLKSILNRAVLFGRIEYNPYDRLRGKFKRGDKESTEFLTEAEMDAIESLHPVEGSMMAVARDIFVFQMHTGLAYADTQAFDFSKYKKVDGRWMTVGKREKTGIQYVTQLSDECERILNKYSWQLPKLGNADYNHCLKALGAAAGIEKPLHSHLARHSFATRMAASGAPIQNVSRMLGHSNIQQTLRYAKIRPESVLADFKKFGK